ncbi:hypothetical protein LTR10_020075 [Elasticomyces elasticus]|uniref:Tachykinin family protein n=1 Tax=Exophiala sideris TaxID=1016849 RepID=A0ABR0IV77_9EURO|nr:hypothetical protein LTR10_020075 [Elasticomyces elasticus]KAK5021343.1 hypothetical protein LTS07_011086 [Exophiala sideris]KAK5024291.1 hypothetical protein LTR13_010912 [Exophiala sideris]KAK5049234.1 hypothetical protein LTR69_011109 [Exophiala sideris]KAK5176546.1 hypothetical protein LTR44_010934 [Eurotiomycetes sp. CCFEE 6388]
MAPGAETRVLFVPYRPSHAAEQGSEASEISLQKHAAREYHRKAKLARLEKAYAGSDAPPPHQRRATRKQSTLVRRVRPDNDDIEEWSRRTSCQTLPGTNTLRIRTAAADSQSPVDVGVGKLDPFNVLIRRDTPRYVQEMLDYAVSYQWPVFSCSIAAGAISEIKHTVLASAMRSQAAFYTIVFAGAAHNAFAHTGMEITRENKILRLTYKTHAIKALNNEISSLKGHVSDELLLSMVMLGAHGSGDTLGPRPNRTYDSSLLTAQNFHFYGHMNWETAHLDAVKHMVQQRGGLHTVRLDYLSNLIALMDVIVAFKHVSAPSYPLRVSTARLMMFWPYTNPKAVRPLLHRLGTGFRTLPPTILDDSLFRTIDTICEITKGYDLYVHKNESAPQLIVIIWGRNCLIHDLLSLPDKSSDPLNPDSCLYEVCRLSTLAYMLLVLFPFPRVSGLHHTLAQRLMLILDTCWTFGLQQEYRDLFLWATLLGGILAQDTASRVWFTEELRLPREQALKPWDTIKDVCVQFLWFEQDCDAPGEEFWTEVSQTSKLQPIQLHGDNTQA